MVTLADKIFNLALYYILVSFRIPAFVTDYT